MLACCAGNETQAALQYLKDHDEQTLRSLLDLVAIPSVSALPGAHPHEQWQRAAAAAQRGKSRLHVVGHVYRVMWACLPEPLTRCPAAQSTPRTCAGRLSG